MKAERSVSSTAGRLTLRHVNKFLREHGVPDVLHAGKGYFYFNGPNADKWPQQGVYVYRINQLTLQQWLQQYNMLKEQGDK